MLLWYLYLALGAGTCTVRSRRFLPICTCTLRRKHELHALVVFEDLSPSAFRHALVVFEDLVIAEALALSVERIGVVGADELHALVVFEDLVRVDALALSFERLGAGGAGELHALVVFEDQSGQMSLTHSLFSRTLS